MVEEPLTVFWRPSALADLDRFVEFLFDSQPQLASEIAAAIIEKRRVVILRVFHGREHRD